VPLFDMTNTQGLRPVTYTINEFVGRNGPARGVQLFIKERVDSPWPTPQQVFQLCMPADDPGTATAEEQAAALGRLRIDFSYLIPDITRGGPRPEAERRAFDRRLMEVADDLVRRYAHATGESVEFDARPGYADYESANRFRADGPIIEVPNSDNPRTRLFDTAEIAAAGELMYARDMHRERPFSPYEIIAGILDPTLRTAFQRGHCHSLLYAAHEVRPDWDFWVLWFRDQTPEQKEWLDHFTLEIPQHLLKDPTRRLFDSTGMHAADEMLADHSQDGSPRMERGDRKIIHAIMNSVDAPEFEGMFQTPALTLARRSLPLYLRSVDLTREADQAERLFPNHVIAASVTETPMHRRRAPDIHAAIYHDALRVVALGGESLARKAAAALGGSNTRSAGSEVAGIIKGLRLPAGAHQAMTLGAYRGIFTPDAPDAARKDVKDADLRHAASIIGELERTYPHPLDVVRGSIDTVADTVACIVADTPDGADFRRSPGQNLRRTHAFDVAEELGIQVEPNSPRGLQLIPPVGDKDGTKAIMAARGQRPRVPATEEPEVVDLILTDSSRTNEQGAARAPDDVDLTEKRPFGVEF
jgi:hypothetical protein